MALDPLYTPKNFSNFKTKAGLEVDSTYPTEEVNTEKNIPWIPRADIMS